MKKDEEIWKDISGYEKLYQVSNLGNVKSLAKSWVGGIDNTCIRTKDETILTQKLQRTGRFSVKLSKNGKRSWPLVHRLVLEAFVGKSNLQVNHLDGNPLNNRLENLEWVTAEENIRHGIEHGLFRRGENHPDSTLTEIQVIRIKTIAKNVKIERGFCIKWEKGYWIRLAESLKIDREAVRRVVKGTTWKHIKV